MKECRHVPHPHSLNPTAVSRIRFEMDPGPVPRRRRVRRLAPAGQRNICSRARRDTSLLRPEPLFYEHAGLDDAGLAGRNRQPEGNGLCGLRERAARRHCDEHPLHRGPSRVRPLVPGRRSRLRRGRQSLGNDDARRVDESVHLDAPGRACTDACTPYPLPRPSRRRRQSPSPPRPPTTPALRRCPRGSRSRVGA